MMRRLFNIFLLVLAGMAWLPAAQAEDIDLFSSSANAGGAAVPNLLLVMDTAAGFSASTTYNCTIDGATNSLAGTVGGIEQCALYKVIEAMPVTGSATVNIGIMVYKSNGIQTSANASCSGSNGGGGCLVYPLTGMTTTTKPQILAYIKAWKNSNSDPGYWIKANGQSTGQAMQESWAYFKGKTGLSGTNYVNIAPPVDCGKNYVLFIGNAWGTNGTPGDSGSQSAKAALEGTSTVSGSNASPAASTAQKALLVGSGSGLTNTCGTLNFPATNVHENNGFYADEWSRYMLAQSITTYSIGLIGGACKPNYPWLLNSMASVGGGKYYATSDFNTLKTALETVISEVQSVNSVFASVSLPVSVNTQGTYLNQVFVGMFRPDADSFPRWYGNLKQYKLGSLNGVFRLLDADDGAAISSSGSDFVAECARSFWTPAAVAGGGDGYWTSLTTANCAGYPASANSPDGNFVEKGGQGYMLRAASPATRVMKTCSPVFASCTTLTDFNTSNTAITQALMDNTSTVTKDNLVNFGRGQNVLSEAASVGGVAITTSAMRPSAHGDVVHSRPVAINFGTDSTPKVVVFYGGNDGVLRAINGNRTTAFTVGGTSIAAGAEFWSFMPPEFYGNIKRLYQNTAKISNPNVAGTPKNYGMDGTVSGYRASNGDAWIFAGMRRGGRAMYAFKVDGSTMAITLEWKRGCDASTCTNDINGDFTNIGQTWASAKTFNASGYASGATPMLAMGGGYDATCEDAASYSCGSTTGNRVYILDAYTGVLLKSFSTIRSVVGDVTFIKGNDGMATYGYAADMGGNLYRISGATANTPIGNTVPANWTITQIASLGCATVGACTSPPNRKFIFGPDIVVDGSTNVLLLGSGDREKPLNTANTTSNYFFMIKDVPTDVAHLTSEATNCTSNNMICLASLLPVTSLAVPTASEVAAKKGWYRALAANEQVVTSAITVFGTTYFSTHQPKAAVPGTCTANLGVARAYQISYTLGSNTDGSTDDPFTVLNSGGLPPSPVAGKVTLDNGSTVPFVIGCKGPLEACQPTVPSGSVNPAKIRSYWFIKK